MGQNGENGVILRPTVEGCGGKGGSDLVGDVVVVAVGGGAGDHLADETGEEEQHSEDDCHEG